MKVFISPSDQYRNTYADGVHNEANVCHEIAKVVERHLENNDIRTLQYDFSMYDRVRKSNEWGADLHLCIHTNAFNGNVQGTRAFCNSLNKSTEGYKAIKAIFDEVNAITPGKSSNIKARPGLYEVRSTKAPCAYLEVEFHDNLDSAAWIVSHIEEIGKAIAKGICKYACVVFIDEDEGAEEERKNIVVRQALLYKAGALSFNDIDGIDGPKTRAAFEALSTVVRLLIERIENLLKGMK